MSNEIKIGSQARVIQTWKASFSDPLVLEQGEWVHLEKKETEALGWVWCVAANGKGGWVPEAYLSRSQDRENMAQANRFYDAVELTVNPGERLVIEWVESGWCWVSHEAGIQGWVPSECIEVDGKNT